MRIAHVSATFPPYFAGTGLVCYYNALGLARRGHQVSIFTASHSQREISYPAELTVHLLPTLIRFGNAPFTPQLINLKDFEIIHLHHPFIFGAEMMWLASQLHSIPYVITHHNDLISPGLRGRLFDIYTIIFTRLIFSGAKKCIFVTKDHALNSRLTPLIAKYFPKVLEIPNGVDTDLFNPNVDGNDFRQKLGFDNNVRVLLFVGALDKAHHYRRVDLLIEAVKAIDDFNLHLVFSGGGDQLYLYRNLVKQYKLESRVHFLGKVSHFDLPEVYAASDIVVLPSSVQESFGMTLIEAMACGKPFIASNLPGVRTLVDGHNGLLVEPGSLNDLIDKIKILIRNDDLRHRMGNAGWLKVIENYDWSVLIPKLEEVYKQALAA